jgi:predicted RNA-binding Zn-ribbon protein involved in translation (DUF1610 family)
MLKMPNSMDECLYFTNRTLGDGWIKAWVYKKECPKCGKEVMGKPVDEKTGKVKIRAKEYVCPECGHTETKKDHEEALDLEIMYKCPFCGHEGEATTKYKRRTYKGVKAFVFKCGKCNEKIGITKKMKEPKKKK